MNKSIKNSWQSPKLTVLLAIFTHSGNPGGTETDAAGNGPLYPASG